MPYRKRKIRRKKRKKTAYNMAQKALKKVNNISRSIEIKYFDRTLASASVNWVGNFTTLNTPIQGLGANQRTGDKIWIKGLHLSITCNSNGVQQGTYRFIVIYDKKNTISDIASVLQLSSAVNIVNSPYNPDFRRDYIVLKDRLFHLNQGQMRERTFSLSCRVNKVCQYLEGTETIEQGALKYFFMSNIDPAAPALPLQSGFSRVWYSDS